MLPKKGVIELAITFNLIAKVYNEAELVFIGKLNCKQNGKTIKSIILDNIERITIVE